MVSLLEGKNMSEGLRFYQTAFIKLDEVSLTPPSPYRLFKLTPNHFYILDPNAETDKRVEVKIKPFM